MAVRLGARLVCPGGRGVAGGPGRPGLPSVLPLGPRGRPAGGGVRPVGGGGGRAQRHRVRRDGGDRDRRPGCGERGFTVRLRRGVRHRRGGPPGSAGSGGTTLAVARRRCRPPLPLRARAADRPDPRGRCGPERGAPGSAPTRPRFLQRNRMIATMTQGTVVVEAGLQVRVAQHRRGPPPSTSAWWRCVPGPVTSMMSAGCHEAVRDGIAVLVTDAAEAADAIGDLGRGPGPAAARGGEARRRPGRDGGAGARGASRAPWCHGGTADRRRRPPGRHRRGGAGPAGAVRPRRAGGAGLATGRRRPAAAPA